MNMERIAKYIGLLFMMVFLTSCPVMEKHDPNIGLWLHIKNATSQILNIRYECEIPSYSADCNVYKDNVNVGTLCFIHGIGYDIKPEVPFDFYISECTNKHIIITSTSNDTLANWNDSSAVFTQQYWLIEHQENGDVHCTLQLTDEVLKLR